jgi:tetratricopeptide (TPR) repeat protein
LAFEEGTLAEHLSEEELGCFFRGESSDLWPHLVLHVTSCDTCRRRCVPWFELLAAAEAVQVPLVVPGEEAYDAVLDRVYARVLRQAKKAGAELASLTRLAQGEDPVKRLQGWARVMALLERSFALRYTDPRQMADQAFLAYFAALHLDETVYGQAFAADVRARAAAELGNAHRVLDNFAEARTRFAEAEKHFAQGTGDPLLLARILDLAASLAGDERRFGDALEQLDHVREIYEELGDLHLAGRALASAAMYDGYQGCPERAVQGFRKALDMIDRHRDPQLFAVAHLNFLYCATECGEYREAARVLFASGLRQALGQDELNLAKLRWVEAKIHLGLGRLEAAEAAILQARTAFQAHGQHCNAAIAALDLAEVWLRQGARLSEVSRLAAETLRNMQQVGFGREAVRAAGYLVEACREGLVTVALIQHVSRFLTRFERDPNLAFGVPS